MKCQVQRKLFLAFLLVLVNSSCVAFVSLLKQNILQFPKGLKSLQSSSYVGASFGTDSLVRPDDEDSQEFKEYLKKLLEMQSMRARTGFSAPSSGSSDAYFAKLNRIKLERAARRELGLPEDVPDFDYKPEDYQSAGTDMEKNADTDLKNSEVFGPKAASNLARPLTAAEVRLAQAAEERAKRALQGLEQIPVRSTTPSSSKVESKKAPQIPTYEKPAPPPKLSYLEQRSAALTRLNPTPSSPIPPIAAATTTTTTQKPQAPTHANKKPTVTPKSISEEQTSAAAKVEIPSSTKLEPTKPAQVKNLVLKRKLEVHELDVVGRALEMTVKHRGGGPFGPGRLPESEIPKLEEILNQAYQILAEDSKKAVAVEVESGAKTTEPLPKLNIQSKQQVQQKPSQATLSSQRSKSQIQIEQQAQKLATPVMEPIETVKATPGNNKREDEVVRRVSRATPSSNSQQVVPITVGIDRFLTRPEDMHVQELESVRDGLIQILAMLQDHIKRRPRDAPIFDDHSSANNPTLHQAPTPVIPVVDPTDRFISTYFKSDDEESKKFDQELQLALGLLLKHRGGPGFGHGRLKGKELNLLEQTLRSVAQKLQQESQ